MKYLLVLVLFGALPAAAMARPVTLDDFPAVGLSVPAISPDGARVAYMVARPNLKADRYDRTLNLYDLRSNTNRVLVSERKSMGSPQWSPDGTRLAFLAQRGEGGDAHEQVFVLDMRGGEAVSVTGTKTDVEQFAWRPDGGAIAFVAADESRQKRDVKRHLDAFVVGDQSFLDREAPTPHHIWLVNADGTGEHRVTSGSWSLPGSEPPSSPASPISWSPDGHSIAFSKQMNSYFADGDQAVNAMVDVATGAVHQITQHTQFEGYPLISPDGTKVAYWYPYNGDPVSQNDIFVTDLAGGNGNDVTAEDIDSNVQRAIWMPDSKSLIVSGHKGTDAALWLKPLGARATRLQLGLVQPTQSFWLDASVSGTGALAFTGSEPHHPVELYYMASVRSAPLRLTHYNDNLAALDQGRVEAVAWNGPDGFDEDGVVTYPPNYDAGKVYPLVLVIHGGPNSASITSYSLFNQYLASRGYIVFNPNYRGSDNLGNRYWRAIAADAGDGPGRDVMAGVAALQQRVKIDPKRIGVSGWSYGGYMTTWLIGHYHSWRVAVAGAAVTNAVDEYALADNGVGWRYQFGGSPYVGNNITKYREQSPVTYAWNVTTPTLLLSDTRDSRVPITQSYEFFRALRDRGTTVRFFAYPVAGHFPGDPVRARDVYRRWSGWLDQYLR